MTIEKLFGCIKIGETEAKNRLVLAPITTNTAEDGFVSKKTLRYYEQRAEGGTGTIIVEPGVVTFGVDQSAESLGIYDDKFIPGLNEISDSIKVHEALAIIQLCHAGPKLYSDINKPVSASEIPIKRGVIPRRLERNEINKIIQDFRDAAERAKNAGFDGVELHAAHFYLLSAFLSPYTNIRDDEFGGGIYGRSKIVCEIIKEIKSKVGKDFTVICRINAHEKLEGGLTLNDAKEMCRDFEKNGADAIHVSAYAVPVSPAYPPLEIEVAAVPTVEIPQGCFVEYATEIKKSINIPVITVGKIFDPIFAKKIIEENKADLVAMGRQLIADPHWPKKVREGRIGEINMCTYCGVCHLMVMGGKEIECPINEDLS